MEMEMEIMWNIASQFKQERSYSEIVNILGIVSEYVVDYKKYLDPVLEALILGEVNAVEIQKLCGWARDRFGSALDLQAIWRPHFIPGWLLEYPPEHYSAGTQIHEPFHRSYTPVPDGLRNGHNSGVCSQFRRSV